MNAHQRRKARRRAQARRPATYPRTGSRCRTSVQRDVTDALNELCDVLQDGGLAWREAIKDWQRATRAWARGDFA